MVSIKSLALLTAIPCQWWQIKAEVRSDHAKGRYETTKMHLVNPSECSAGEKLFLFQFGAYGTTFALAWGYGIEEALENAAAWLKDNAPGLFTDLDLDDARQDLARDRGVDAASLSDEDVYTYAETDLTYTESGYLASWEWSAADASKALVSVARAVFGIINE
jgi:hypothetical protein